MQELEFSSELASDSKHLMKPLAERLRRLSTGSMHMEVCASGTSTGASGRPAAAAASPRIASSDASTSGFRKCTNTILELLARRNEAGTKQFQNGF